MNVVDSSGWIEYLKGTPDAEFFRPVIEDVEHLIVPTISLVEVFRWVFREEGRIDALHVAALMLEARVVALDEILAFVVARMGVQQRLPLADSVILATARAQGATLWTQDADFQDVPGVRFRAKR